MKRGISHHVAPIAREDVARNAPWLRLVVLDVVDLEANLLADLALHALLNSLTDLHKAGDECIDGHVAVARIASEHDLVALRVPHADDDGGIQTRKDHVPTAWTCHGAKRSMVLHRMPAPPAEAALRVPVSEVNGRIGHKHQLARTAPLKSQRAVMHQLEALGHLGRSRVWRQPERLAIKREEKREPLLRHAQFPHTWQLKRRLLSRHVHAAHGKLLAAHIQHALASLWHHVRQKLVGQPVRRNLLDHAMTFLLRSRLTGASIG